MAKSATLDVKILVDAAQAASGLNDTAQRFEQFASKAAKMFAAAFVVDKAVEGIKKVVNAASDLEQAVGGTDKIFGASATKIHEWAKDTTDSIRIPQREFEQLAVAIGASLKATGAPMDQVADQTRNLMQVSADFAATFGRDIVDVADAVRAALAGEYDTLQNMGVVISGNAVAAEALIIAQGDAALAAQDATKTQAAYNILMEQGAQVAGQAAAETTTFSGQTDALKEKLDNLAGAAGGPLLDSFGGIIDKLATMTPMLQNVAVAAATFVGWIAGLPAPILAAAAAFAVLTKIGVASMFLAAGAAIRTFVLDLRTAPSAMGTLTGAIGSLAKSLSPHAITLGLSLIAAAILKTVGDIEEASGKAEGALKPIEDALVESGGHWTAATRQLQQAALMGTDAYEALRRGGVSAQDALSILSGNADLWRQVQTEVIEGIDRSQFTDETFQVDKLLAYSNALEGNAQRRIADADAMGLQVDAAGNLAPAQDAAAVSADALAEAYDNLAGQLQAVAEQSEGAQVIAAFEDASKRASLAADYLNASLDRLTGRQRSSEAAQVDLIRGMQDVQAAFTDTSEGASVSIEAINAWDVAALQSGKGNQAAYDSLTALTDQYTSVVSQAYAAGTAQGGLAEGISQASQAADKSRADFVAMMAPILGSTEAAETLANRLGLLNGTEVNLSVLANTDEAQQKIAQLEALNIDPKSIKLITDDQATPAVESAISYTDRVTGEEHVIHLSGDPTTAEDALAQLLAAVNGSHPNPIPLTANPAPAEGTAQQFTNTNRQTNEVAILANSAPARNAMAAFLSDFSKMTLTATLNANTAPARQAMEAFRSDYSGFTVTATILGNSAPARQAISALEGGSYRATVSIYADTAPFMSAWNSLPTSKTITVTVNQVQGSVVAAAAPPAPALARTTMAAAPTLARTAATGFGAPMATAGRSAAPMVININTGVGDPDAIARAVKRIVLGRDRRTGGVVVGEMRARVGHS